MVILILLALALAGVARAEVRRPFTTRFEANATGDIFHIGNTSLRADPSDPDAAASQNGMGTLLNNNDFSMVNVDVDADGGTFNSSSADFTIPPGGEVLWAGLYWGADTENATAANPPDINLRNEVFLSTGSGYQSLHSNIPLDVSASGTRYQGFAEVTGLVRLQSSGSTRTYTVANVQAVTGTGPSHYAGWSLVIVLQDPAENLRHLHVFDGYAVVSGSGTVNTNVSGFRTPLSGAFATHVGMVAYEGDLGTSGDFFQVNGSTISDLLNPPNNLFNSAITRLETQVTAKNPNFVNQLGFDIDLVDLPYSSGIIPNGATSADLTFSTNGDWYYPGVLTFGIDIYSPILEGNVIKTMTDLNGGALYPGDIIAYTISVTNTGNDDAINMVLQDSLSPFTNYVGGSLQIISGANAGAKSDAAGDDQAEFDAANDRVIMRLGTGADGSSGGKLGFNETTVVSFQVQVDPTIPDGATIENTALVDYIAFTSNEAITVSSNTMSFVYPENADLVVTKTVDESVRDEGDPAVYTLTAANNGPYDATGVQLQDNLPNGVLFQSAAASQGSYDNGMGVWNIGTMASGSQATLDINVIIAPGASGLAQPITNTAAVYATNQLDPDNTNDSDGADIFLRTAADLNVGKTVDQVAPDEGGTVSYTITLANGGPGAATGISLADPLPAGVTFVAGTPSQGSYVEGTGVWTVGDLASGTGATLTIPATVDAGTAGSVISNSAAVSGLDQIDPDPANDTAVADILVGGTELALNKTVDTATPTEGQTVTYTVVVTNSGQNGGDNITVSDRLPAGVTYASSTASQGSYNDGTGVWVVGNLVSGSQATLTISATVDAGTAGSVITNTASITAVDQGDPDPTNNTAAANITVQSADLSVTKMVDDLAPSELSAVTYTVSVTNNGPTVASNVTVTDQLPVGLTYISSTRSQGAYDWISGNWTVGTLANGATSTLTITATVDAGTGGATIINTAANLNSDQPDPNSANDQAMVRIRIQPSLPPGTARLDVIKASDAGGSVFAGDPITYTISVTNTGTVPLSGVGVTDALPTGTAYTPGSTQVTAPTSTSETVRDEFNTVSYAGNHGSQNWSNDWQELGESDGPNSGHVEADTSPPALEIGGGEDVNITGDGASRAADLSGALSATLSLDVWRNNSTSRSVTLAVWDDAVGSWVNLKTYPHGVPTPTVQTTETFDLTPYISANTQIRFLGSGSSESTSYIYFDNVEIAYTLSGPPATNPGGPPPNLANGYFLAAGEQMTVTFQVSVNSPFDDPDGIVNNLATATSDQTGPHNSNAVADRVEVPLPDILLVKTAQVYSDPVNGQTNSKAIPGAVMLYTIALTNQGIGSTDADSLLVTELIPNDTALFVGDFDGPGPASGPVLFSDGTTPDESGLTYTFINFGNPANDVVFSNDGGGTYTYVPSPDTDGFDAGVTHLRVNPKGAFSGVNGGNSPGFELRIKVRVE